MKQPVFMNILLLDVISNAEASKAYDMTDFEMKMAPFEEIYQAALQMKEEARKRYENKRMDEAICRLVIFEGKLLHF
jgi:hypothetical protein